MSVAKAALPVPKAIFSSAAARRNTNEATVQRVMKKALKPKGSVATVLAPATGSSSSGAAATTTSTSSSSSAAAATTTSTEQTDLIGVLLQSARLHQTTAAAAAVSDEEDEEDEDEDAFIPSELLDLEAPAVGPPPRSTWSSSAAAPDEQDERSAMRCWTKLVLKVAKAKKATAKEMKALKIELMETKRELMETKRAVWKLERELYESQMTLELFWEKWNEVTLLRAQVMRLEQHAPEPLSPSMAEVSQS
jgi:hypothetical protein